MKKVKFKSFAFDLHLVLNCHDALINADYNRKRYRDDEDRAPEMSKRSSDYESRRNSDYDSRPVCSIH